MNRFAAVCFSGALVCVLLAIGILGWLVYWTLMHVIVNRARLLWLDHGDPRAPMTPFLVMAYGSIMGAEPGDRLVAAWSETDRDRAGPSGGAAGDA